ncbi:class I adenylate-forming enzyme family protein [Phytoactinopolyspora halotolerans]|uniref:AMP-binding protein n=1 Tax=Phytoactinopolyspora halotolerans TaxID=1981512 RepID=A0A6L9S4C5_9ACTN|nr:AMP-binding protein [Phytoactinopolyspora halotolerans]NED99842.1 AMP-binding protein [Phytoactinopolyspora halotolerans]
MPVQVTNTIDSVVRLLGALRTGCTVAVIDANAPQPELDRQIGAIDAAFDELVGPAAPATASVATTSLATTSLAGRSGAGRWILMTGGSTGQPRPVVGPRSLAWDTSRGVPLLLRLTGWRPGQVQLVMGPLHHAAPFTCLLDAMLGGNTVVIPSAFTPELLFDLVDEFRVEWTQLTPVHMRLAEPLLGADACRLRSLRAVLHTAAPCPVGTKTAWLDAVGAHRLYEMYAATEGIGTTLCRGPEWRERPGTVGRGVMTRIRILDEHLRDVPVGEVGQVYMRGPDRAVPAAWPAGRPSAGAAVTRGFRTVGDQGRLDRDGYLYLAGRKDDLVLVGGENVYLGEVEAALFTHGGVRDVVVIAVADPMLGASLRAYVVPRDGARLDERSLRAHCRRRLPPSKTPQVFDVVDHVPRNAAGKLQRFRLGGVASQRCGGAGR